MRKSLLIFSIFLIFSLSHAAAFEISTNARVVDGVYYVVKGQSADIDLRGDPGEEISIHLTYTFKLPSSNGEYVFSQNSFPVPISGNLKIRAYPVENLTIEASFLFFTKTLSANASNGVAEISTEVPLSGSFNVKMNGKALGDEVTIESIMSSTIKLDENGRYHLSYDTSVLPCGEMSVVLNGETLRILVVSSESEIPEETPVQTETPEPTPTLTPSPEETQISGGGGGTSAPVPEPSELPEQETPEPTPELNVTRTPELNLTETPELNATVNVTVTQTGENLGGSSGVNITESVTEGSSEEVEEAENQVETPSVTQSHEPNESPGFGLPALVASFSILAYLTRKMRRDSE
ncbi:MAG: hypothetical protein PWR13_1268 [Archaeoglobi archaeon]|nr:hypothetical protein [Archaeoglobi archaeon]